MSSADAPDTLTPLMRLRRQRRIFWTFGALLLVGIALLAGTVLSVNHGRNFERLVTQLGLEHYLPSPRVAGPPPTTKSRRVRSASLIHPHLIAPITSDAGGFRKAALPLAQERCMEMGRDAPEPADFQETPNGWECILSQDVGTGDAPSVLFIQARGASADSFRTLRAKLSFLLEDQDETLIRLTLEKIDRFGLDLSTESRRYVEDLLKDGRDVSSILENYRIVFERERGDGRRFNLIITPRALAGECPATGTGGTGASLSPSMIAAPVGCLRFPPSSGLSLFAPVQPH